MITILLAILKIIGMILLVILGLVLLILCLALFAPVKYRAKGAKHPEEMYVSAFLSYLSPLVRVRVSYPAEQILSVKILWFDLLKPEEEKKAGTQKKKTAGKKTARDKKKSGQDIKQPERDQKRSEQIQDKPERKDPEKNASLLSAKSSGNEALEKRNEASVLVDVEKAGEVRTEEPIVRLETFAEENSDQGRQNSQNSSGREEQDTSKYERAEKKTEKKANKKAPDPKEDFEEKSENKIVAIAALLWQYKEMYPDVLGRIFRALKTILPRKCNIHLIFGTGAPETTGYLYAAYCALGEYLPGTIEFEPVWMESYLDVEFELGGRIRLIHFVTAAVKIIADKRVRHFISEIRRI